MKQTSLRAGALAAGLIAIAAVCHVQAQDAAPATTPGIPAADDPSVLEAEVMPRAAESLILDIVDAGDRAVAVGERGHILVSETRRDGWRQIENVPTRSNLNAVTAIDGRVFAVGHDSVILRSDDGGLTWARKRVVLFDKRNPDPRSGGPLLDVMFIDRDNGFAVGAYATLLRTSDGGETWTLVDVLGRGDLSAAPEPTDDSNAPAVDSDSWNFQSSDLDLDEETDPHLNAIGRTASGSLFIVAERGAAFRSIDNGSTWERIQLPYGGSMFGVIAGAGEHVLCFGLRGNVYESYDLGTTWTKRETGTDLSLMGGAIGGDGSTVLVGGNGVVLSRSGDTSAFLLTMHPDGKVLSSVLVLGPGEYTTVGESGISFYQP